MANEFVDLRELLPDNVPLLEKLDGLPGAPGIPRPWLREVSSLLTWCTSMPKLIAVQAEDGNKVKQMCTYTCLVVQETRKHGRDGWSAYNRLFRQHTVANSHLSWATLDGSIHAVTFLASRKGSGTHCRLCADSDHLAHECTLALVLSSSQPTRYADSQPSFRKALPGGTSSTSNRPICNSWNRGSAHMRLSAPTDIYAPRARRTLTRRRTAPTLWQTAFLPSSSTTSARQQGDRSRGCLVCLVLYVLLLNMFSTELLLFLC